MTNITEIIEHVDFVAGLLSPKSITYFDGSVVEITRTASVEEIARARAALKDIRGELMALRG